MVEPLCQHQLSVQQLQLYQLCLLTINYYQCSQGVYAGNVAVPPVLRTCFAAMLLGCLCSAGFRSSWWGMWWCWELGCLWVWFCVPYFNSFSKNFAFSVQSLGLLLCSSWGAFSPGCWLCWSGLGFAGGVGSVELCMHRYRVVRILSVTLSCVTLAS